MNTQNSTQKTTQIEKETILSIFSGVDTKDILKTSNPDLRGCKRSEITVTSRMNKGIHTTCVKTNSFTIHPEGKPEVTIKNISSLLAILSNIIIYMNSAKIGTYRSRTTFGFKVTKPNEKFLNVKGEECLNKRNRILKSRRRLITTFLKRYLRDMTLIASNIAEDLMETKYVSDITKQQIFPISTITKKINKGDKPYLTVTHTPYTDDIKVMKHRIAVAWFKYNTKLLELDVIKTSNGGTLPEVHKEPYSKARAGIANCSNLIDVVSDYKMLPNQDEVIWFQSKAFLCLFGKNLDEYTKENNSSLLHIKEGEVKSYKDYSKVPIYFVVENMSMSVDGTEFYPLVTDDKATTICIFSKETVEAQRKKFRIDRESKHTGKGSDDDDDDEDDSTFEVNSIDSKYGKIYHKGLLSKSKKSGSSGKTKYTAIIFKEGKNGEDVIYDVDSPSNTEDDVTYTRELTFGDISRAGHIVNITSSRRQKDAIYLVPKFNAFCESIASNAFQDPSHPKPSKPVIKDVKAPTDEELLAYDQYKLDVSEWRKTKKSFLVYVIEKQDITLNDELDVSDLDDDFD